MNIKLLLILHSIINPWRMREGYGSLLPPPPPPPYHAGWYIYIDRATARDVITHRKQCKIHFRMALPCRQALSKTRDTNVRYTRTTVIALLEFLHKWMPLHLVYTIRSEAKMTSSQSLYTSFFKSQMTCHRVLHGVFNRCIVWTLLKTLCSKVLL